MGKAIVTNFCLGINMTPEMVFILFPVAPKKLIDRPIDRWNDRFWRFWPFFVVSFRGGGAAGGSASSLVKYKSQFKLVLKIWLQSHLHIVMNNGKANYEFDNQSIFITINDLELVIDNEHYLSKTP